MAEKTPEQLREQILKNISKLNEKDAKTHREMLATAKESNDEAAQYNVILRSTQDILDEVSSSFSYIIQSIRDQNNELSKGKSELQIQKAALNKIQDISRTSLDIRRGETVFEENKFKKLQEQAKIRRQDLELSYKVTGQNDEALKGYIEDAKELEKAMKLVADTNKKINKELGFGINLVSGFDKALAKLGLPELGFKDALDKTKMLGQEAASNGKEAEKNFSAAGTYVKQFTLNLKESLTTANLITLGIGMLVMALIQVDKSTGELAKSFGTSYKEASNIRGELNTISNLSGNVNMTTEKLGKSLMALNKEFGTATMMSGELLKDFTNLTNVAGYSAEAAAGLARITVATGTDLSDNTAEILGTTAAYNGANKLALNGKEIAEEVAKTSAATTLTLGMQPGAIAKAVLASKALGASMAQVEQIASSLLNFESSIEDEMSAELLLGKNLNLEKARTAALNGDIATVAAEIAKQTGTAADFEEMNVIQQEALAKAVGMTREGLASSLMEREALVRLGKEDGNIQEEYNALKAKGLSDDAISKKLGSEKLADQLKSQSVQEKFNATVEKLREVFVSIAEPILKIVSPFVDLASKILPLVNLALLPITFTIGLIGEGIGYIIDSVSSLVGALTGSNEQLTLMQGIIGTIAGIYLAIKGYTLATQIIQGIQIGYQAVSLGFAERRALVESKGLVKMIGQAVFSVIKSLSAIPFIGPALGFAAAAAVVGMGARYLTGDDVSSKGYGKRTFFDGKDTIALNDQDQFVAGTDLMGTKKSNFESSIPTPSPSMDITPLIDKKSNSESSSSSPSIDITPLIDRMSAVEGVLVQILNKEFNVYLDSTKIGTGFAVSTVSIQ
jgi:hypothetical protein